MTRARCGRAIGLPSRPIASWKPPPTWSAPSFHHSGSATSNSQRLSAAASLATSLMPTASGGEGLRSSPSGIGRSLLAGGLLAFFVLYCTKHRQPSANSTPAARSDGSITAPRERTYFEGACSRHRGGRIHRHARCASPVGGRTPRGRRRQSQCLLRSAFQGGPGRATQGILQLPIRKDGYCRPPLDGEIIRRTSLSRCR